MRFTVADLVAACAPNPDLSLRYEEFKDKLCSQTQLLAAVGVQVHDGPVRSNTMTEQAAINYNNNVLMKFQLLTEFVEHHLSTPQAFENNILHEHADIISPLDMELNVQKFNPEIISLTTNGQRRVQTFCRCNVYFIMKMLQLFSTPRYFNAANGNGLQNLLRDVSITNRDVSITNQVGDNVFVHLLTGEEAFRQKVEMGHTHHLIGGDDINPNNIKVEGQAENNGSKRCSSSPTTECQCHKPCAPRIGPLFMSNGRFNSKVLEIMMQPCKCKGMGEVAIRTRLRDDCIALLRRHGITQEDDDGFHDHLKEDQKVALLAPMYPLYEALRPLLNFGGYTPGITIQDNKVTYEEWQESRRSDTTDNPIPLPSWFASALRDQIPTLQPAPSVVVSNLGELDELKGKSIEDIEAIAEMENTRTFKRSVVSLEFLVRDAPKLVKNHSGSTEEEKACGALHHGKALGSDVQTKKYYFCTVEKEDPGSNEIRNNIATASSGPNNYYQSTLPRLALHASFVFNFWELFADTSSQPLQDITNFLSIRGLGQGQGGINSDLVHAQLLHASHLYHLDLSVADEVRQARDTNTANITWDSPLDNWGRNICSLLPYLTCIDQCKCHTPCKPALFKLTESKWYETCEIQYALGSAGRHPGISKNRIKLHYLNLYRQAYENVMEGVAVPGWMGFWEDYYTSIVDGNDNKVVNCDGIGCDQRFLLFTDAEDHERQCPSLQGVAQEEEEEEEEEEEAEVVVLLSYMAFGVGDVRRLCEAIILEGPCTKTGNNKWIPAFDMIKTLHRNERQGDEAWDGVLRVPESGRICGMVLYNLSRIYKSMCQLNGIADAKAYMLLLKNCNGHLHGCGCDLHNG